MEGKALYVLAGFDDKTEKKLSNIQNKLYEHGFSGTQTKNIPLHITLGSFSTDKEKELIDEPDVIHEALPAVMKEFTPICGKVTTLYLYEFFPTRHILTVHFDME